MKTIEVTDEIYDFLISLSKEMKNQDNRFTASPYYYTIQEKERIYGMTEGYSDDYAWINSDFDEIIYSDDEMLNEFEDEWDEEEKMEEKGYRKCYYKEVDRYKNCFFTEKAIKKHIEQNHYHYNEPKDYIDYAFRNPELEGVIKFLLSLSENVSERNQ